MTIHKWKSLELKGIANGIVDDVIATIRATLLRDGYDNNLISEVCEERRRTMTNVLEEYRENSIGNNMPYEVVYVETLAYGHTALVGFCREYGVKRPVDLGLKSLSRKNFFDMYELIDIRKYTRLQTKVVADRMELLAEDEYALKKETVAAYATREERLFTLDD